jgi:hypothetical protein
MTQIGLAWGADPSPRYDAIAAQFRPLVTRIHEGAIQRELERKLPLEQIAWLKEARFGAIRRNRHAPARIFGGPATTYPLRIDFLAQHYPRASSHEPKSGIAGLPACADGLRASCRQVQRGDGP